VDLNDKLIS